MSTVFELSFLLVAPFWALMILLPGWRVTRRIVGSPVVAAGPAVVYAAIAAPLLATLLPALAGPSLATIAPLLGSPEGATLAWLHFLAFDLFVGRWIYLDARERGASAWVVSPILATTLMVGPVGLLAWLAVRRVDAGRVRAALGPLAAALGRSAKRYPALALLAAAMGVLLAVCLVGLVVDERTITGLPAWAKPAKFALSTLVYAGSLLWMLGYVREGRAARLVANGTAAALAVELAIIVVQAARGTTSHFNVSTPLDGALFATMGAFIVIVWIGNLVAAVLMLRERLADPVLAWSLRFALLVTLTAAGSGALMTRPTAEQRDLIARGEVPAVVGSHTVGAPDGGAGLPFLGWSTEHGDFRPAHFLGLHALQAIPLAGWALSRRRSLVRRLRLAYVTVFAATYLGAVVLLTWQALRGQPVVAPDAATLAAAGALAAAAVVAAVACRVAFRGDAAASLPLGVDPVATARGSVPLGVDPVATARGSVAGGPA
jgi:hypothetical protein